MKRCFIVLLSSFFGISIALANGHGRVAKACKVEIEKLCSDKVHENREVRTCLENKKEELSKVCLSVLESTGSGKGMGQGRNK